jgi:hypothetical protein
MIKIEKIETYGWEAALRGMRNPMNSWDKADSFYTCDHSGFPCRECIDYNGCKREADYRIGPNDHELMMKLARSGTDHAKYRRMITVTCDITAPLYWWKEFDPYKVGTVANSCSTMHKIHAKEFTLDDFSHEHLEGSATVVLGDIVDALNIYRERFITTKNKIHWWQMIQLLPSSYNQKRTILLNYEVLRNMYHSRKNHKLDEWRTFCERIEKLPYSEIITDTRSKA